MATGRRIKKDFIDRLIDQSSLHEVVSRVVNLKRNGHGKYLGCCPFHSEKTPSFHLDDNRGLYHCFGCGASGNIVSFMTNYHHLDFASAIVELARIRGVEVEYEINPYRTPAEIQQEQERKQQQQLDLQVLEKVTDIYQYALSESLEARKYLYQRQITPEMVDLYRIGFAPDHNYLLSLTQFPEQFGVANPRESLIRTVMIKSRDNNQYYDTFRMRIMFPIANTKGEIVGFGGRTIVDHPSKYINSSNDSSVYNKSLELYGLWQVISQHRQLQQKIQRIILVEGYLDVISLAQFGIFEGVAASGTAIQLGQVKQIFKHTDKLVMCFDGDRAGRSAAYKSLVTALPLLTTDRNISLAFLPDPEDPDSYLKKFGKAQFEQFVNNGQDSITFLVEHEYQACLENGQFTDASSRAFTNLMASHYAHLDEKALDYQVDLITRVAKITGQSYPDVEHILNQMRTRIVAEEEAQRAKEREREQSYQNPRANHTGYSGNNYQAGYRQGSRYSNNYSSQARPTANRYQAPAVITTATGEVRKRNLNPFAEQKYLPTQADNQIPQTPQAHNREATARVAYGYEPASSQHYRSGEYSMHTTRMSQTSHLANTSPTLTKQFRNNSWQGRQRATTGNMATSSAQHPPTLKKYSTNAGYTGKAQTFQPTRSHSTATPNSHVSPAVAHVPHRVTPNQRTLDETDFRLQPNHDQFASTQASPSTMADASTTTSSTTNGNWLSPSATVSAEQITQSTSNQMPQQLSTTAVDAYFAQVTPDQVHQQLDQEYAMAYEQDHDAQLPQHTTHTPTEAFRQATSTTQEFPEQPDFTITPIISAVQDLVDFQLTFNKDKFMMNNLVINLNLLKKTSNRNIKIYFKCAKTLETYLPSALRYYYQYPADTYMYHYSINSSCNHELLYLFMDLNQLLQQIQEQQPPLNPLQLELAVRKAIEIIYKRYQLQRIFPFAELEQTVDKADFTNLNRNRTQAYIFSLFRSCLELAINYVMQFKDEINNANIEYLYLRALKFIINNPEYANDLENTHMQIIQAYHQQQLRSYTYLITPLTPAQPVPLIIDKDIPKMGKYTLAWYVADKEANQALQDKIMGREATPPITELTSAEEALQTPATASTVTRENACEAVDNSPTTDIDPLNRA